MAFPRYRMAPSALFGLAGNLLLGGRRSFRQDARDCLGRLEPALRLEGGENLPTCGPALITFNHYARPGFQAWWMALAVSAAVPADIHFIMTSELTYSGKRYASIGQPISRWVLRRLAEVYGFTRMPPMPPRPKDLAARAHAVRQFLEYAHRHPDALLGLSPEGGDQPGGVVSWPAPGAGRFLLLLAKQGCEIRPVGIYEEAGELCLRFGPGYRLEVPNNLSSEERDQSAAGLVMQRIAALLPTRLRGPFD